MGIESYGKGNMIAGNETTAISEEEEKWDFCGRLGGIVGIIGGSYMRGRGEELERIGVGQG